MPDQGNGLDQLALHEAALGHNAVAVELQLLGDLTGVQGAKRLARAAQWLDADQFEQADQLLETALDQAAAAGPGDWPWTCCTNSCNCSWWLGAMARGAAADQRLATVLMTVMRSSNCSRRPNPIPCAFTAGPGGHAAVDQQPHPHHEA